jgi:glycosyltransferase involved in cell wall biosynthesis
MTTRVLFLGDLALTGFGTVTTDLGRALLDRGIDVRFVSLNGTSQGAADDLPEPFASRTARISDTDGWLSPTPEGMEHWRAMFTGGLFEDGWTPEQAIVCGDVASLQISPVLSLLPPDFRLWHYCPIEGVGLPPSWGEIWKKVSPIAMCEFGASEIAKLTKTPVPVIYHGVDTRDFAPVTAASPLRIIGRTPMVLRSREECRRFLGWPQDAFIMFRADRLMPRKQYGALLRASASFLDRHSDAMLILHCLTQDQGGNLFDVRSHFPDRITSRMKNTGLVDKFGGVPRQVLRAMYAAADVYVSTSAEGFGLTIAESLACGTPAIGLEFSSVPEVIGPGGWTVPIGYLVENVYAHWWAAPKHEAYVAAMEEAYGDPGGRQLRGKKGLFHVLSHFSWQRAAEQFAALIDGTAERGHIVTAAELGLVMA